MLARSLARGEGFTLFDEPHSHFPPGFPSLLAVIGAVDRPSLARAALLNALLLAVNVWLIARWATRTSGAPWAGTAMAALFVSSPAVLALHTMVWSEPAFLALLSAAVMLAEAAASGRRGAWVLGGACLGAAVLTRYAGVALGPPVLWAIVRQHGWPWRRRLTIASLMGLLAIAPAAAWALRNMRLAGSVAARPAALHPLDLGHARGFAASMSALWGLGESIAVGLLIVTAVVAAAVWRRRDPPIVLAAFSALSYVVLLLVSLLFFDADTPLDTRLLVPLYVLSLVIVAPALVAWPRAAGGLMAALVAVSLAQAIPRARRQAVESEGFNRQYWRSSATLAALRSLPPGTRVHTNAPEWVAFETDLATRDVPVHHSRVSLRADAQYPGALQALCVRLAAGDVLVYFDGVSWRWEAPAFEDIRAACGLQQPARFDDGLIFRVTPPP